MRWSAIPSFERLPLKLILHRNYGRRAQMLAAAVDVCEVAIRRGIDERTMTEWVREAVRPFDRYAHQRGEFIQ